jgi:hypothetical protein
MARILIEGFESGNPPVGCSCKNVVLGSSTGCDGAYCQWFSDGFGHLIVPFPGGLSEVYIYFRYKRTATTSYNFSLIDFFKYLDPWDASGWLAQVRLTASTYIPQVYAGKLETWLANATTGLTVNTWFDIEIYYKPHYTEGRFILKVNGNIEIDFTGNTNDNGGNLLYAIGFGNALGNAYTTGHGYIDNLIIDDANWIHAAGEQRHRVSGLVPTGAGANSQWTGSYDFIDEVPLSEADGIEVNAVDQVSTFAMSDISGSVDTIKCLQVDAALHGWGAHTPKNVKPAIVTGGSLHVGNDKAVGSHMGRPGWARKLWETNPATAVAFTPSEIAGIECGVKSAT